MTKIPARLRKTFTTFRHYIEKIIQIPLVSDREDIGHCAKGEKLLELSSVRLAPHSKSVVCTMNGLWSYRPDVEHWDWEDQASLSVVMSKERNLNHVIV